MSLLTLPRMAAASRKGPPQVAALMDLLHGLFEEQRATGKWMSYLDDHGHPRCVENHVRSFLWYQKYLPERGDVLDWGCSHGPDSCLLRSVHGDRFNLYACDLYPAGTFPAFMNFSGAHYKQLSDVVRLPYPDASVDVLIGSGTLEHVAMDYESLKEVYRVLRTDGVFIGTYLPHRFSYQEWYNREVKKIYFHRRRYSRREITDMLKHTGLDPLTVEFQTYGWDRLWDRLGIEAGRATFRRVMSTAFPIQLFSSTLRFVARKVAFM